MKLAVFGTSGQVATELRRRATCPIEVIGRNDANFSDPGSVRKAARGIKADAIVNAVAYTAVDKAETEPDLANRINGASVAALGEGAVEAGVPVVHISSDYVFPGTGDAPWRPQDATGPLGAYGKSKLLGEEGLAKSGARHVILRTSWVFSAHGGNFVKTMLRLAETRDHLSVVADQIGGPTPAADLADACLRLAEWTADGGSGTFHFAGAPDVSWAGFAREIFDQSGLDTKVTDVPTSEYPLPAKRPMNSRFDCLSLETDVGIPRPDWREGLAAALKELAR